MSPTSCPSTTTTTWPGSPSCCGRRPRQRERECLLDPTEIHRGSLITAGEERSGPVQIGYRMACAACKAGVLDTASVGRYPRKGPDFTHALHGMHWGSRFCI